ncbi:MAG: hypothetical protein GXN92_02825 [Candidatus Micrarchaeota archaeon]|nr:hypothetical protein [Candidatus Micrarchaeota archaeon]
MPNLLKPGSLKKVPNNTTIIPLDWGFGERKERGEKKILDLELGGVFYRGEERVPVGVERIEWMGSYPGRPLRYLQLKGVPREVELREGYVKVVMANNEVIEARKTKKPPFFEVSIKNP